MTSPRLNASLASYSPAVISLFRAVIGFLFAMHGSSILFGWPIDTKVPVGLTEGWLAGLIEFVAGLLVMIGLFTRPAAFLASGTMAVAYFWKHQPIALWPIADPPAGNHGELAILYCFAFFLLVFAGGGVYALDARRR